MGCPCNSKQHESGVSRGARPWLRLKQNLLFADNFIPASLNYSETLELDVVMIGLLVWWALSLDSSAFQY